MNDNKNIPDTETLAGQSWNAPAAPAAGPAAGPAELAKPEGRYWAIHEGDLLGLMSSDIGAAYVDPVAAAERCKVSIYALATPSGAAPAQSPATPPTQPDQWKRFVDRAISVLQRHIVPDGLSDHAALLELYEIFDGSEFHAMGVTAQMDCELRQAREMAISKQAELHAARLSQPSAVVTAEQQQKECAPPFAAPASQHEAGYRGTISAGEYDPETSTMYVTVKLPFAGLPEDLRTINGHAMLVPVGQSPAPVTAEPVASATSMLSGALNHARDALRFYAERGHFQMHQPDEWDTVSGEPQNFYEDSSNTATVEDGSVAKRALEDIAGVESYASATHPAPADRDAIRDQAQQWISVDERLPEVGAEVLSAGYIYDRPGNGFWQEVAKYTRDGWHFETTEQHYLPTHWMPLPSQPSASHATKGEGDASS